MLKINSMYGRIMKAFDREVLRERLAIRVLSRSSADENVWVGAASKRTLAVRVSRPEHMERALSRKVRVIPTHSRRKRPGERMAAFVNGTTVAHRVKRLGHAVGALLRASNGVVRAIE